ncbi:hypothetical protein E1180_21685 [Roseibium denhamense]|uniref:Uncharacterized protein n=1 Tax=Roseibium denhamense TaxID=76305 RepID=A0ABY1NS68_9HYPH|nr:hypothetical protein [Roseibium denhamense]MTI08116.1 hypothetical protein [Roseibium denhamense]SMP16533.1 hypothetical protein SAMN06265374_1709 [Roseibium denhamense]
MTFKTLLAATVLATSLLPNAASAVTLQAPGNQPLQVTKLQMGIKGPTVAACPADAKLSIWVFTNKEGTVPVYIAKEGGQVAGPYQVTTQKTGNSTFMGVYSRELSIHQPIEAHYRASAPGFKALSNWVPLKASCSFGLGG